MPSRRGAGTGDAVTAAVCRESACFRREWVHVHLLFNLHQNISESFRLQLQYARKGPSIFRIFFLVFETMGDLNDSGHSMGFFIPNKVEKERTAVKLIAQVWAQLRSSPRISRSVAGLGHHENASIIIKT